jgi:hypothetical protein
MKKLEIEDDGYPGFIPGFDPVALKRKIHAEIRRETKGMTDAEVLDYFHKGAERFDEKMRLRRAERQAAEAQS